MVNLNKRKDKGLSQVISTLILLVVAILLTTVVVYYATNVTMTRTKMEEVRFSKEHVWVNLTGAVAGFKLQNLGGRDILMDKFSVRSVESPWSNIYIYRVPSGSEIFGDVNVTSYARLTGPSVIIDGNNYTQAVSDVPLISGGEVIVYVKGPENISLNDLGTTVSISCTTNNAEYITEINVESATEQ